MLGPGPSRVRTGGFSSGERDSFKGRSEGRLRRYAISQLQRGYVAPPAGATEPRPAGLLDAAARPTLNGMEPEQRFFTSQRLRLSYWVWGDERRPPVVLVHGGRDHARNWDAVA